MIFGSKYKHVEKVPLKYVKEDIDLRLIEKEISELKLTQDLVSY